VLKTELDLEHSLRDLDIKLTRVPPRDQTPQGEDAEQRNNSGHLLLVLKNKKAFSGNCFTEQNGAIFRVSPPLVQSLQICKTVTRA
jgi:hypothetical protein